MFYENCEKVIANSNQYWSLTNLDKILRLGDDDEFEYQLFELQEALENTVAENSQKSFSILTKQLNKINFRFKEQLEIMKEPPNPQWVTELAELLTDVQAKLVDSKYKDFELSFINKLQLLLDIALSLPNRQI